jgi:hypothetical protein
LDEEVANVVKLSAPVVALASVSPFTNPVTVPVSGGSDEPYTVVAGFSRR